MANMLTIRIRGGGGEGERKRISMDQPIPITEGIDSHRERCTHIMYNRKIDQGKDLL